jgi:hypothetical protein
LADHIPNRLVALALLAPHCFVRGERERASPKFPKIPTCTPTSPLLLSASTLVPANLGASPYRPSAPCYFDVPGVAPSTLTDFAGVVKQRRGRARQLRPSPNARRVEVATAPNKPPVEQVALLATAPESPLGAVADRPYLSHFAFGLSSIPLRPIRTLQPRAQPPEESSVARTADSFLPPLQQGRHHKPQPRLD